MMKKKKKKKKKKRQGRTRQITCPMQVMHRQWPRYSSSIVAAPMD
jgi:hypothetical protein